MVSFKQTGFGGGLIGPQLRGKTVQEKYQTGLEECLNCVITRFGSVENRAGTQYVGAVKDSDNAIREVPFIFNANISYMLEFGNLYIRPWKRGARISVVGAAAYAGGTTYAIGDLVTSVGIVYYSIQAGNTGHTPASSAAYWHPQAGGLLEIPTNIPQASLSLLQYVQQNDVMTIAEQAFIPQQLIRYSDTKWAFQAFAQSTGIDAPVVTSVTAGVAPIGSPATPAGTAAVGGVAGVDARYRVTAWSATGESDSSNAFFVAPAIEATLANPITASWTAVGGALGYALYKQNAVTGPFGLIAVIPAGTTSYQDNGDSLGTVIAVAPLSATGSAEYTYEVTAIDSASGAESLASNQISVAAQTPTFANPNVVTWTAVAGAAEYHVFRVVGGTPGYIGLTLSPGVSFSDPNITPDTSIQPPSSVPLFQTPDDYPGVVGYYQQRLGFANSINQPQTVTESNVGNHNNFSVGSPVTDDAAVSFTIAGKQVQEVRALIDLGKLIIHTSGDEYVCTGNQAGALTPTGIGLVHQGSAGCSTISPIVIGNCGIFVQARGSVLRDLEYSIYSTSFKGRDLTVFAPHLFVGRTIVDMAWQQIPDSIIWCVMSDGALLGLTYIKDHDIWAWHRHDSNGGSFENVVVVPEDEQDVVYYVIKRTIDGATKRYIEKLNSRDFTSIVDARFVDSGLTYDGRNLTGTTMTATTGGGWTPQDDLTMTASASFFAVDDVGSAIVFQDLDDNGNVLSTITFDIIAYTSATIVTVQSDADVPAWAQLALTSWGKAVHEFSGIDHLEGETIAGLGDGNVIPQTTVVGGAFTTENNIMVLTAGLPITADLKTLPIENQQGETIANKKVLVVELTPVFYNSRGGTYGQDFSHLKPWIQRQSEPWNDPVALYTGPQRLPINGTWQKSGDVCFRQADPLPIGISAIIPTGQIGN